MSSHKFRGIGGRFALLMTAAALTLAVGASAASASISLSPEGPYSSAEGGQKQTSVTVKGTSPFPGTTEVAIAVCNENSLVLGERCDLASATAGLKPLSQYNTGLTIKVRRGPWPDWDFTSGSPTEGELETTCKKTAEEVPNSQCAVVVSYYEATKMGPARLGEEKKAIFFS